MYKWLLVKPPGLFAAHARQHLAEGSRYAGVVPAAIHGQHNEPLAQRDSLHGAGAAEALPLEHVKRRVQQDAVEVQADAADPREGATGAVSMKE
jgi:hypothetical protein